MFIEDDILKVREKTGVIDFEDWILTKFGTKPEAKTTSTNGSVLYNKNGNTNLSAVQAMLDKKLAEKKAQISANTTRSKTPNIKKI